MHLKPERLKKTWIREWNLLTVALTSILLEVFNRVAQGLSVEGLYPRHQFGLKPRGNVEKYRSLFSGACAREFDLIDDWEKLLGFAVDKSWLDNLAFRTQVTVKSSSLNWQHGRVLYSAMRRSLDINGFRDGSYTFLETGTARGFSSICAARALIDSGQNGTVITIDSLPHDTRMLWNVVTDEINGPITRSQLLEPWEEELKRIVFVQGWTRKVFSRIGLTSIDFAFLDAQHKFKDVLREFRWVAERQGPGSVVLFDDVTPGKFDGVVAAVDLIESEGNYEVNRLNVSEERGYAIATRL